MGSLVTWFFIYDVAIIQFLNCDQFWFSRKPSMYPVQCWITVGNFLCNSSLAIFSWYNLHWKLVYIACIWPGMNRYCSVFSCRKVLYEAVLVRLDGTSCNKNTTRWVHFKPYFTLSNILCDLCHNNATKLWDKLEEDLLL